MILGSQVMVNPTVIRAAIKTRKIVASIIFVFSGTFGSSPAFGQDYGQILARAHWDVGNRHEFVYVSLSDSTWEEAQSDLSNLLPGFHLATITSQEEHDFLIQLLDEVPSFSQGWLGGFQDPPDEPDPSIGWTLVTGEAWSYTNWHDAEPNDGGGCLCENHLAIDFHRQWNDEGTAIGTISGYFAESFDPIFMDGFESTIDRGNIIVLKATDPTGPTQSFDFTTNYGGGAFSLTDGQSNDSGALVPTSEGGTYSVSETVPAGWSQTSATCDDGSPIDAIDLGPGETVTCTFTNTPNTCPCWEESELQVITAANIAFPASISCDSTYYPNYLGMADVDAIIAFEAVSNPNGPSGPVLSCGAYDNTPYWQDTTMAEADICIAQLAQRCTAIGYPVNVN
jgi:hypothetical protein